MRASVLVGLVLTVVPAVAAAQGALPPPPAAPLGPAPITLPARRAAPAPALPAPAAPPPVATAPSAAPAPTPGDLAPAYAPLALVAVMLETGQALVWDETAGLYRLARVGETVAGWKVVTIEAARVVVVSAEARDELALAPPPRRIVLGGPPAKGERAAPTPVTPVPAPVTPTLPPATPAVPAPVAPAAPLVERRTVTRAELDRELGDFDRLGRELDVAPAAGGGFRLTRLTAGSWVYRLGLREGDVVRSVAGVALASVDDAARAYAKVRSAKRVEVQVDRPQGAELVPFELELEIKK